ncbi:S8 family peptidase [Alteribacter aurantiacus]|uniref:S8 family peptidase n=1 Tax=Alteribacter aurantiacus TaxID=254410 RepID=UPI0004076CFE|nr:S8 family peptidase [Alteribacter aurantiacus]
MKRLLVAFMTVCLFFSVFAISASADSVGKQDREEYLVMFDGKAEKGLLNAFGVSDSEILHEYDLLPVYQLSLTKQQARGLQNHPQIKYVEADAEVKKSQTTPYGVPQVQATDVHQYGYFGQGVRVAVLDTGIDANHSDLNVYGGHSVFSNWPESSPYYDGDGHGTHVAGTVAALNNSIGVLGVAPSARLYAVKVLDSNGNGSYSGIAQGIEWSVNNGMDIINMSLGGSQHSSILQAYSDYAYNQGVLLVAAAGNSGNASGTGDSVNFPAKYNSVMAVAAVDWNNNRASFSSTGPTVEIAAPGVNIQSTFPGNTYRSLNGTSMASPHVAGVAALLMHYQPGYTNAQVRSVLNNSAKPLGNSNHFGNGLVQAFDAFVY